MTEQQMTKALADAVFDAADETEWDAAGRPQRLGSDDLDAVVKQLGPQAGKLKSIRILLTANGTMRVSLAGTKGTKDVQIDRYAPQSLRGKILRVTPAGSSVEVTVDPTAKQPALPLPPAPVQPPTPPVAPPPTPPAPAEPAQPQPPPNVPLSPTRKVADAMTAIVAQIARFVGTILTSEDGKAQQKQGWTAKRFASALTEQMVAMAPPSGAVSIDAVVIEYGSAPGRGVRITAEYQPNPVSASFDGYIPIALYGRKVRVTPTSVEVIPPLTRPSAKPDQPAPPAKEGTPVWVWLGLGYLAYEFMKKK